MSVFSNFVIAERSFGSRRPLALLRWALVLIFIWFGCMKFTSYEANGISGLIVNSPIMGWLNTLFGVRGASATVGVLELATAIVLILGAFIPLASAVGAAMSCMTYLITLTFLISTPGAFAPELGGFPALSSNIGQFLIKDVVLLAASLTLLLSSVDTAMLSSRKMH